MGRNLETLNKLSIEIEKDVLKTPGAVDAQSTYKLGAPEWGIDLDSFLRPGGPEFQKTSSGAYFNSLVQGNAISYITINNMDYNIVFQLNEKMLSDLNDVKNLAIQANNGERIPLSAVASIIERSSPKTIGHEYKQRRVSVSANIANGYAVKDVMSAVKRNIDNQVIFPAGYSYKFGGQAESYGGLAGQIAVAMLLAVIFIYMIIASLYNSFIQPLYIIVSLPLAFIGAFLMLLITGINLDIFGYIGLIMVLGLVAKNAILLLDFTNNLRQRGLSIREAIVHAGPVRLRPILMTSFAVIFGMLPMALGLDSGSSGRQALPLTVIGGIITSTFLTLVVVPVIHEWSEEHSL